MSDKMKKTLVAAFVAAALAVAVSYGLVSQQTADSIQAQTNRTLSDGQAGPAPQQSPQAPDARTPTGDASPAPRDTAPQDTAPRR